MKKIINSKVLLAALLLIPLYLVFGVIFTPSSMSLGDAPYFNNVSEYFTEPQIWTEHGNSLGNLNQFIWIWPLMFVISLTQKIFQLNSSVVIRLFFYLPSIVLAVTGSFALIRKYKISKRVGLVASLLSVLNTYFLLVFDGGQVGILLAYGLFPWVLLSLLSFFSDKFTYLRFGVASLLLSLLTIADPRVALICLGTSYLFNIKKLKRFLILTVTWFFINLYWLYPLINVSSEKLSSGNGLQLTSFLTGLYLYSPHWYQNIYGNVTYPTVTFLAFPLLIFSNLFFNLRDKKRLMLLILLFIFLIKGATAPFGSFFSFITSLPFGNAFRDSTKFFIPLIFISAILIGNSIEKLSNKYGRVIILAVYALIVLAVLPAIKGNLNFVLSGNESNKNVVAINNTLKEDNSWYRSVWFPERDSRSLDTSENRSIDAKDLVNFRIFSRLNVGTSDLFNFLNYKESNYWLDLIGAKYLILSGDPRSKELSTEAQKDWNRLNNIVDSTSFLTKVNNENIYRNDDILPPIYGVKKLVVVTGPDDLYEKLEKRDVAFKPTNLGFVFVDDGKWDPSVLDSYASSSAVLVDNNNDPLDLQMSLLKEGFLGWENSKASSFANYHSSEYLKYKYELLIRKIDFKDFDFNKGISFSTKKGESISFEYNAEETGNYMFAIRFAAKDGLGILIDEKEESVKSNNNNLIWKSLKVNLSKGKHIITIHNTSDIALFNVISVTPEKKWNEVENFTRGAFSKFSTYTAETFPKDLLSESITKVEFEKESETRFKVIPSDETSFIIFTDTFNDNWKIVKDTLSYDSLPFYSSVNGIYKRPEWDNMTLEFVGQKQLRFGIYLSTVSVLFIIILIIWSYSKKS